MTVDEFVSNTTHELEIKSMSFFRAKISPNANENKINEILDDEEHTVKIQISAKPEKGKANKEIVKFLGKLFRCECQIIAGNTGSVKLVKLTR